MPSELMAGKKDSSRMTARQRAKEFGEKDVWGEELQSLPMSEYLTLNLQT